MRRLLARAQWEAKGYVKSATLQDHDGALARGARDTRLSLARRITRLRPGLLMLHSFNVLLTQTAGNGNEPVRDFTQ
jgi:hypothetical protein